VYELSDGKSKWPGRGDFEKIWVTAKVTARVIVRDYVNSNPGGYKKNIEWRLQVQIAFLAKVNLAPSRPEQPCKENEQPGRTILPASRNFGCHL
jgi:hypothetical protein